MSDPFLGLAQGQQMFNQMFYGPQLQQLDMLQKRAQINQAMGLDPVSQSNIQAQQANIDLARQQEARLQEKQEQEEQKRINDDLGMIAYVGSTLPKDQQDMFFSAIGKRFGIPEEEITPENIEAFRRIGEAKLALNKSPMEWEFKVVGDNVIKANKRTGTFEQIPFQPNVQRPEGITDSQWDVYQRLPSKDRAKFDLLLIDPEKTSEKTGDIQTIQSTISQISGLINDPDFDDAVGLIDQYTSRIGSFFGSKAGVLNKRAERVLNNSVVSIAKSLGANPTDRDMKILEKTQPSLGDKKEIWMDWFNNQVIPAVNARLQGLGAENVAPIPTPTTQEEYDSLPSGSEYIDPDDGKRYRKP